MTLFSEEPWSHMEVRKLVALIASEHRYATASLDALPFGIGVLSGPRVRWSNQKFRSIGQALSPEELQHAVERALQPAGVKIQAGSEGRVFLRAFASQGSSGEVIVVSEAGTCPAPPPSFETLDLCDVPLLVYDRGGRILFANTAASRLSGYEPGEPARTSDEIFPGQQAALTAAGECSLRLRKRSGASIHVRASVNAFRADNTEEAFCLAVLDEAGQPGQQMLNVAALEGCLVAAFPNSSFTRTMLSDAERFDIRGTKESRLTLTATHAALRSDRFREHLRDIPKALSVTTVVRVTEDGVSADV